MQNESAEFPAPLGYHMPAEWEPHEATWLAWPHNPDTWPGKLHTVPPVYADIVRALMPHEKVRLIVPSAAIRAEAESFLASRAALNENVEFFEFPTDDSWARDFGPIFVVRDSEKTGEREVAVTKWKYNCWGGKYPGYRLDNEIPYLIANYFGADLFDAGIILEGGSIDVNGQGTLLTTEACLLNPNRNPELDRATIEDYLRAFLGIRKVLWLGDGIEGDDTDGHIDDLARFVNPTTIVTVVEEDPADPNFRILRENLERLAGMTTANGEPIDVVTLPMPSPLHYEGQRLPASYANFLVANNVVLLPTYNCPRDAEAAEILAECFPGREIVGIPCTDLVWGLGAIHCISQQQPAGKIAPPRKGNS
ncbi:MAG: agmatine deiminase [Candidatus Sumerlaeota bacterium]|nr:agmatine deiminase [Candidatus Sumerlaeota bacterium]